MHDHGQTSLVLVASFLLSLLASFHASFSQASQSVTCDLIHRKGSLLRRTAPRPRRPQTRSLRIRSPEIRGPQIPRWTEERIDREGDDDESQVNVPDTSDQQEQKARKLLRDFRGDFLKTAQAIESVLEGIEGSSLSQDLGEIEAELKRLSGTISSVQPWPQFIKRELEAILHKLKSREGNQPAVLREIATRIYRLALAKKANDLPAPLEQLRAIDPRNSTGSVTAVSVRPLDIILTEEKFSRNLFIRIVDGQGLSIRGLKGEKAREALANWYRETKLLLEAFRAKLERPVGLRVVVTGQRIEPETLTFLTTENISFFSIDETTLPEDLNSKPSEGYTFYFNPRHTLGTLRLLFQEFLAESPGFEEGETLPQFATRLIRGRGRLAALWKERIEETDLSPGRKVKLRGLAKTAWNPSNLMSQLFALRDLPGNTSPAEHPDLEGLLASIKEETTHSLATILSTLWIRGIGSVNVKLKDFLGRKFSNTSFYGLDAKILNQHFDLVSARGEVLLMVRFYPEWKFDDPRQESLWDLLQEVRKVQVSLARYDCYPKLGVLVYADGDPPAWFLAQNSGLRTAWVATKALTEGEASIALEALLKL
ncbi:MAG: hypothetical protein C5B49_08225 [Bdellovibrio sp.]|nr:MAG: hypothetical protein C5B49_08225 [Bdellovibrio sp.]